MMRERGHGIPTLMQGQFITGKKKRPRVGKIYQRTTVKIYRGIILLFLYEINSFRRSHSPCPLPVAGVLAASAGRESPIELWYLSILHTTGFKEIVSIGIISLCTDCVPSTITLLSVYSCNNQVCFSTTAC